MVLLRRPDPRCRFAVLIAVVLLHAPPGGVRAEDDPARWVDPFIGTGGHGHTFPGATLPFGMVQLSPDTRLEGWDGCSGYHDSDDVIYGFSHTHLSGTGVADYCDVLLAPITGAPTLHNGSPDDPDHGYASRFHKSTERAEAGYYAARLTDYGIDVELTATPRVGMHRYRFPTGAPTHVIVDLKHRDRVLDSWLRIVSNTEIEGLRRSSSWARDQWVYFVARFSRPFTQTQLATADSIQDGVTVLRGEDVKAVLSFGSDGGPLLVKLAISAVDCEGARRNLDRELPGWDFDATRAAARKRWNEALGRVSIGGASNEQRRIFATALYHSMIAPNLFSDVDGRYRGMDQQIHTAEGREQYTVFSLWDTFRATHPLYTLLEADRTGDFIATFLAQFEQGGRLPVWELAANETDCMIGYHSVSVIADAYLKGIGDFDSARALEAMVHSAELSHRGLDAYRHDGFIGADRESESVSKTLEYAYDDWCIARMAEAMGEADTAQRFYRRSQAWRHLLDPTTGFFRPRQNQRWLTPFDPWRVDFNYTEANAWQYRFFVPHDVEGLMQALGGDDEFVARLDSLFSAESATTGRDQVDITGLIGQYAHGNEPSHHMAWLYHYAGRPDRSAETVHRILDELYAAAPDGLSGNEDCGQMSSWYVLSSLGLYQVAPGSNEWLVGTPRFPEASLRLENGRTVEISAPGVDAGRIYIQGARWNDEPLERSVLPHSRLVQGGRLELELSDRAEGAWGRPLQARPRSSVPGPRVPAAPYLVAPGDSFRDELEVSFHTADPDARLQVRGGDAHDVEVWRDDIESLRLRESTRLFVRSVHDGIEGPALEANFHRIPHDWTVEVSGVPNSQYTAGGPEALIDGRRGPDDWRTGMWQGYQAMDFVAVVDMGEIRMLRRAGASFLQDMRSWIWMPSELVVESSIDGEHFEALGVVRHSVPDDVEGVFRRDFVLDLNAFDARYVRVRARNYGTIPDWHPGRGGEAFIFVDEIVLE